MDLRQRNLGYSLKNIPIASNNCYKKKFMEKVESLIRRMRWIAYHFDLNNIEDGTQEVVTGEYYGFKSVRTPPSNKFLLGFENGLYALVQSIEFKSTQNKFQKQLKRDVREIVNSDKVFVFADKTTNLYEVGKSTYNKSTC